jgi:hypothetical protein
MDLIFDKEKTVIVGGAAMFHHGLVDSYNDIDVVVTDINDIEGLNYFESNSTLTKSGKRAYVDNVDVFIEDELPEYEVINGFKIATIESMAKYYREVIDRSDGYIKEFATNKLKILKPQ